MSTKKIRRFQNEPIRNKNVRTLGGIGEKHGEKLRKKGYGKAANVVREFMSMEESKSEFVNFLRKNVPRANRKHVRDCYESVSGWCDNHPDEKDKYNLQTNVPRSEE